MTSLDYTVVALYLAALLILGAWLARRAGKDTEAYFLGGRGLPWWALGASGMSSNLDVAGTMTIVTLLYLFGLHGFFIEMRGGVVLPIAVFTAFMGAWHRRSMVMTTAEWMLLRFGDGPAGKAARVTAAATYVVITIGMVVFFLGAAGKFLSVFLPFSESQCQVGMLLVALGYTMMSGLYGVVWTDVLQAALIGGAAIYVSVVAAGVLSPELVERWPGHEWNAIFPRWHDEALKVEMAGKTWDYRWFGFFLLAWMGKGLLEGLGGSGGSAYMAQRFYAARTEGDCRKIGMLWTVLFAFRWPMVLGFTILAVYLGIGSDDPERILPQVLSSDFFPAGVRGLMVAAMLAAAMSTFDSTINAGASYLVKDVYEPLRKGKSSAKELVYAGYVASLFIVLVGLVLAFQVESVVGVWIAIVINLFPAFLVPFALRWYWWRMNGWGFAAGVILGFGCALLVFLLGDQWEWNEIQKLGLISLSSLVGTFGVSLATAPVDATTGENFYRQIRPFGLWPKAWQDERQGGHKEEFLTLAGAVIWQVSTFLLPMTAVLGMWNAFGVLLVVWILSGRCLIRLF